MNGNEVQKHSMLKLSFLFSSRFILYCRLFAVMLLSWTIEIILWSFNISIFRRISEIVSVLNIVVILSLFKWKYNYTEYRTLRQGKKQLNLSRQNYSRSLKMYLFKSSFRDNVNIVAIFIRFRLLINRRALRPSPSENPTDIIYHRTTEIASKNHTELQPMVSSHSNLLN